MYREVIGKEADSYSKKYFSFCMVIHCVKRAKNAATHTERSKYINKIKKIIEDKVITQEQANTRWKLIRV